MGYFTADHVRLALHHLPDRTHPSLVTFLAMLRAGVPSKNNQPGVPFGSEQEHGLLQEYFSPPGRTAARPFYVPFDKSKKAISRWKVRLYGGTGLQRMREDRPWVYRHDATGFAFVEDLNTVLKTEHSKVIGAIPLSVHHLAAWMYRNKDVPSHSIAIQQFAEEFNLAAYGLVGSVFSLAEDPLLGTIALGSVPIGDNEYAALLEPQLVENNTSGVTSADVPDAVDEDPEPTAGGSWGIPLDDLKPAIEDLKGVQEAAMQALSALRAGMHVVFTGPPGSGKTQLAQRLCKAASFDPWLVTATDSWTTFETIGGYFPKFEDGKERLDFEAGVVVSAMQQGRILIIDEINRADIDKAFGELFTLLSGSDVDLPHRRRLPNLPEGRPIRLVAKEGVLTEGVEAIRMPEWWRIIGAMNDSDKASLKRLSFAFVRRFAFIPVGLPSPTEYTELIAEAAKASGLITKRPKFIQSLTSLFADANGLASIGLAMGFAIPKVMLHQALAELGLDETRSDSDLLISALNLYVCPQLQGRADKHEDVIKIVKPHLDQGLLVKFSTCLLNWTGFVE